MTGKLTSRLCNKGKRIDASNKVGIGMYPGRHPRSDKATWGEGAEWIQLLSNYETNQHIDIVVRGEKILGVSIYCDESNLEKPIEVKVEDSTWHTFPLEESSLKDLFGDSNASYQWRIQ